MPYVDKILEPGETVVWRARVSWTIYAPAIWLAIVAIAAFWVSEQDRRLAFYAEIATIILALAAVAMFLSRWFQRSMTEIAVTDRRVVFKRGFIKRHTVEMNMQKIESVDVDQTIIGRILNYGDVTIRGTGASLETLRDIDAPLKLRTTVTAG